MSTESAPSQFTVAIAPLGSISDWQIKLTTLVLKREFEVKTMLLPAMEPPLQYFNAERGRYQNCAVLDLLFSQLPAEAQRIVGVVEGGLENDKNDPCLGCASLYSRVAVHSVLPSSQWEHLSIKDRVDKDARSYIVITHEFSHTLGLPHCSQLDCLMHEGAYSVEMCAHCRRWTDRELKVKPGSAEERFSLAESLLTHNYFNQAIAIYREAIHIAPHEPLYHRRLSLALYNTKQLDKAGQELNLAVKLSNDRPNLYYTFGLSCLNNRLKLAEAYFAKAIATAKDPKFTQKLIGQAYREISHDVELASRHYKEYMLLGGDDPDVVEWLVSRSQIDKP